MVPPTCSLFTIGAAVPVRRGSVAVLRFLWVCGDQGVAGDQDAAPGQVVGVMVLGVPGCVGTGVPGRSRAPGAGNACGSQTGTCVVPPTRRACTAHGSTLDLPCAGTCPTDACSRKSRRAGTSSGISSVPEPRCNPEHLHRGGRAPGWGTRRGGGRNLHNPSLRAHLSKGTRKCAKLVFRSRGRCFSVSRRQPGAHPVIPISVASGDVLPSEPFQPGSGEYR